MYQVEMTPVVKTEIRPVPDTKRLEKLYNVFLDKGVHFRVEQINDEQLTFYWTRSNEYLYDTIAKEISELLNSAEGTTNTWVESAETEQPKAEVEDQQWPIDNSHDPHVYRYDVETIEKIKETLNALYPDAIYISQKYDMLAFRMKEFDPKIMKAIRHIVVLIVKDAVRLISFRGIGKGEADEFMRGAVHEHKEKILRSNYVGDTLTVLVDNDPVVINQLHTRMDELVKKISRKCAERQEFFTYTGPEAEAISDTLTAFYPTKVETKLVGEELTIKWKRWDIALEEEISSLINEIVDNRLRLLTITTIGKEDADAFIGGVLRAYPEKVRQWTYNDDTLIVLFNYEPGLIGKLENRLRNLSYRRFLKDGAPSLLKGQFSDCNCPICQKHR